MLSLSVQGPSVARQARRSESHRPACSSRAAVVSHSSVRAGRSSATGRFSVSRRRVQAAAEKQTGGAAPSGEQPKAAPQEAPEELPPWARSERERELAAQAPKDLPFGLYLLFSSFVAIAAVGSIYEYSAGNPVFGVLPKENPLWAPVLLFFAVTGFPMSAYLFYRSVKAANEESERADKIDGY